jgi:hypothetical protein
LVQRAHPRDTNVGDETAKLAGDLVGADRFAELQGEEACLE